MGLREEVHLVDYKKHLQAFNLSRLLTTAEAEVLEGRTLLLMRRMADGSDLIGRHPPYRFGSPNPSPAANTLSSTISPCHSLPRSSVRITVKVEVPILSTSSTAV